MGLLTCNYYFILCVHIASPPTSIVSTREKRVKGTPSRTLAVATFHGARGRRRFSNISNTEGIRLGIRGGGGSFPALLLLPLAVQGAVGGPLAAWPAMRRRLVLGGPAALIRGQAGRRC